jgi:hypothetical protein
MLYVDIPSLADLKSLAAHREDICVSIYLPTTPVSKETAGDRIELKNLAKEALRQLVATANTDKRRVAALMEHLDDLVDVAVLVSQKNKSREKKRTGMIGL